MSRIVIALALAACGGTRQTPDPSQAGAVLCCDPGVADGYLVSTKSPVVANVCSGSQTLWSGAVHPDKPLDVPIGKIASGKPVALQLHAGVAPRPCLDQAGLAKLAPTRDSIEIKLGRAGRETVPIVPCNLNQAGCTCPVCPDPQS